MKSNGSNPRSEESRRSIQRKRRFSTLSSTPSRLQGAANGVRIVFNSEVMRIVRKGGRFRLSSRTGSYGARLIVNSAGLYSDRIAAMAGDGRYRIYPCRGEYHVLDRRAGAFLSRPVYPVPRPGEGGLGVHLTTTVEGNILIGPSAEYLRNREDYATTREVMDRLMKEAGQLLPQISAKDIIRSYAGIRSKLVGPDTGGYGDFVIEESGVVPGLVNLIGIESPGLTASVPIARMAADIIGKILPYRKKRGFNGTRKGIPRFREQTADEKKRLVAEDPSWGEAVCFCEEVTRREIIEAIENPLGVRTLTGIKYRSRATSGRCQGGFCLPKIAEILVNDYGMKPEDLRDRNSGDFLFTGKVK